MGKQKHGATRHGAFSLSGSSPSTVLDENEISLSWFNYSMSSVWLLLDFTSAMDSRVPSSH